MPNGLVVLRRAAMSVASAARATQSGAGEACDGAERVAP
jgi:hypothetical protein